MRATDIPIASPCGADWRTMKPSDTKRFCEACKKHVHDLSAMTPAEARALLASPPTEGLCVRYLHDAHGDVVFRDAPLPSAMLVRAKRIAQAAAWVALPAALAACSSAIDSCPMPTMGAVAVPMSQVPPAPSASASPPAAVSTLQQVMGAPPARAVETK
jgi:hypothetical protein